MITQELARPMIPRFGITLMIGDLEIPLEFICPKCSGQKMDKPCGECHDLGTIPSQEGARLLAFLKKHLKPELALLPEKK